MNQVAEDLNDILYGILTPELKRNSDIAGAYLVGGSVRLGWRHGHDIDVLVVFDGNYVPSDEPPQEIKELQEKYMKTGIGFDFIAITRNELERVKKYKERGEEPNSWNYGCPWGWNSVERYKRVKIIWLLLIGPVIKFYQRRKG